MVVLAAVSGGAWAQQWVRVGEDQSGNVHYIDFSTIRKTGHMRRFWQLIDLVKPEKFGDRSEKFGDRSYLALRELDCKEERARTLQGDFFRGQMAGGERSSGFNSPSEWFYVAPGTAGETQMKFVCSR